MIFIFGVQSVKTFVKDGLTVRRQCDRCRFISDLEEYRVRNFFTLFFIPVFPISKGEEILRCSRCQAEFYPREEDYLAAGKEIPASMRRFRYEPLEHNKVVISCAYCHGKLRVPLRNKRILVTCPHCRERFDYVPEHQL